MKIKNLEKQLIAEIIGTFLLTLTVGTSINNPTYPIPTPFLAALALGIGVYTIGKISGCHINPAITIALFFQKKIDAISALWYVVAQIAGALLARLILSLTYAAPAAIVASNSFEIGAVEALGAGILAFGVSAVVYKAVNDDASGVTIGGSLLLGITIAASASNAILNPAVAIGINSISAMYLLAPILGAIVSMKIYERISHKEQ